jgi:hypothetical protein
VVELVLAAGFPMVALVKRLVELHGGHVAADRRPAAGGRCTDKTSIDSVFSDR